MRRRPPPWGNTVSAAGYFRIKSALSPIRAAEASPLRTGDSGVSRHVADAAGARFLSSGGFGCSIIARCLSSPLPSFSSTIKSTTEATWREGAQVRHQCEVVRGTILMQYVRSTKCWGPDSFPFTNKIRFMWGDFLSSSLLFDVLLNKVCLQSSLNHTHLHSCTEILL